MKEGQHEAASQQEVETDHHDHQDGPELGGLLRQVRPQRESEDTAGQAETDQDEAPLDSRELKRSGTFTCSPDRAIYKALHNLAF